MSKLEKVNQEAIRIFNRTKEIIVEYASFILNNYLTKVVVKKSKLWHLLINYYLSKQSEIMKGAGFCLNYLYEIYLRIKIGETLTLEELLASRFYFYYLSISKIRPKKSDLFKEFEQLTIDLDKILKVENKRVSKSSIEILLDRDIYQEYLDDIPYFIFKYLPIKESKLISKCSTNFSIKSLSQITKKYKRLRRRFKSQLRRLDKYPNEPIRFIRDFKNQEGSKLLKRVEFLILEGKHRGRECLLKKWRGNYCNIFIKDSHEIKSCSINNRIRILI